MKKQEAAKVLRDYLMELRTAALDDCVPAPVLDAIEAGAEALEKMDALEQELKERRVIMPRLAAREWELLAEMAAANCGSTPCHKCVDKPCYKEAADAE